MTPVVADYNDLRHNRATAKATLAAALALAGSTEPKLTALQSRLDQLDEHALIDALIAAVVRGYATTRSDRAALTEPPAAATAHSLVRVPKEEFGAFRREAADWDTTVAEVIALGIKIAGEQFPDVWGSITDPAKHAADSAALTARFAELCAALSTDVPSEEREDQIIDRRQSLVRVVFRRAPQVGIYEPDAAAQLVASLNK